MFSDFFLKSFRILLLPFALLYWLIIAMRNWFYDKKIFHAASFGLPIIGVGNLSVGGTGKSPMVEWIVRELKNKYIIAVLSRGYMRRTKGYTLANENSTALDIGDEPMQIYLKFPQVAIAVGEKRLEAIPQLLHDRPETELIILDDSFQHRSIKPGLNILLTDHGNLFMHDFYLPAGDLRDLKSSYKRAGIILVTKCSPDMTEAEAEKIRREIHPLPAQKIFFTTIDYDKPFHFLNGSKITLDDNKEVLLVTGIANPRSLEKMVEEKCRDHHRMQFRDHHIYSIDDLEEIKRKFFSINASEKIILTTEKDAVRFLKFRNEMELLPFYVQPINHRFLFDGKERFLGEINNFITSFKKNNLK